VQSLFAFFEQWNDLSIRTNSAVCVDSGSAQYLWEVDGDWQAWKFISYRSSVGCKAVQIMRGSLSHIVLQLGVKLYRLWIQRRVRLVSVRLVAGKRVTDRNWKVVVVSIQADCRLTVWIAISVTECCWNCTLDLASFRSTLCTIQVYLLTYFLTCKCLFALCIWWASPQSVMDRQKNEQLCSGVSRSWQKSASVG